MTSPRFEPIATGPGPAERARSALHAAPVLEVTTRDGTHPVAVHGSDHDGRPLLVVPDGSALAGLVAGATGPVPVRIRAALLRPLEVADRVRGRLEMHGHLDVVPGPEHCSVLAQLAAHGHTLPADASLLRAQPATVAVDGLTVGAEDYRRAEPDPVLDAEGRLLRELFLGRPHDLAGLCTMLDPLLLVDVVEIAVSGLDRYGLVLHITGREHVREARLEFPRPADDARAVTAAVRLLVARARRRLRCAPFPAPPPRC